MTCKDCRHVVLPDAGGSCNECTFATALNMKLCEACSLILSECQYCRTEVTFPCDQATKERVKAAQTKMQASLADINAQYDVLIEPIVGAISTLEASLSAVTEKMRQSWADHYTVRNDGGYGSAVVKSAEHKVAFELEKEAQQQERDAAHAAFAPHLPLHNFARNWKQSEYNRCTRNFSARINHVIAVAKSEQRLVQEYKYVDARYVQDSAALVDPRVTVALQPYSVSHAELLCDDCTQLYNGNFGCLGSIRCCQECGLQANVGGDNSQLCFLCCATFDECGVCRQHLGLVRSPGIASIIASAPVVEARRTRKESKEKLESGNAAAFDKFWKVNGPAQQEQKSAKAALLAKLNEGTADLDAAYRQEFHRYNELRRLGKATPEDDAAWSEYNRYHQDKTKPFKDAYQAAEAELRSTYEAESAPAQAELDATIQSLKSIHGVTMERATEKLLKILAPYRSAITFE